MPIAREPDMRAGTDFCNSATFALLVTCAGVFLASCGRSPMPEAPEDDASAGSGTGGASGSTTLAKGGSGGVTNATGGAIGSSSDAGREGCSYSLPLPRKPCIDCAPLPTGDTSGCAAPDFSIFDWHGGGVDTSLRYPVGCAVVLPTENPYYPGSPQTCFCSSSFAPPEGPGWTCPI